MIKALKKEGKNVKLQQALHPNLVKRLQHMVFVGIVMPREADNPRFFVKCLSPIPKVISDALVEPGILFEGLSTIRHNEKLLSLLTKEMQKQHVAIFRLRYANGSLYVELLELRAGKPCESYRIVPIPYLASDQTRAVLEKKLTKGYVSLILRKYPIDFGAPEFLLYEGRLYGNLSLKPSVSSIMYSEQRREVVYCDVIDWPSENDISVGDHLYFISEQTYNTLKRQLAEKGEKLLEPDSALTKAKEQGNKREITFLQHVKTQALQRKLYMEETDLYNLHICLKTSPITIVAGMSGIGKSQIVKLYAEALGLQYGKELLWIPVSSSFQEPQDLLGYLHPNGTYMESDTGLVSKLLEAQKNPERLYMIVFDEMNMSHIEHWFTPFLSLLELQEEERLLSLYEGEQKGEIPSSIKIGSNLLFIGTINFDETTKELSDRLLDRTPIVTFRKLPFREAALMREQSLAKRCKLSVSALEYCKQWKQEEDAFSVFSEEELEILDALHAALQVHDPSKGVSFRVAAAIANYIANIPRDEDGALLMSREEAFDLQLKQRIFTKLRGMEAVIGSLLAEDGRKGNSLFLLLQSPLAKEVSAFTHSISFLKEKARELELYGYVR
jgi:MoxR-like ATPase